MTSTPTTVFSSLNEIKQATGAKKDDTAIQCYEQLLTGTRHNVRRVLELGVQDGGSLAMWEAFFPNAIIVGVDMNPAPNLTGLKRTVFYRGRQEDKTVYESITKDLGAATFDVIIDDASHFGLYTKLAYQILFDDYLQTGGHYAIEDWGTGYWGDWPDGEDFRYAAMESEDLSRRHDKHVYAPDEATGMLPKTFLSHQSGMVGFVKQLVDEAHRGAMKNMVPYRVSKFSSMLITEGIVVIQKR